jgi:glycosyltransferase involved in cell wall biosynthesis
MEPSQITPVILTFNEAANISRSLEPLRWAQQIVVVDSGSSDETAQIAGRFDNVRVHERAFDSHADQWNYGVSLAPTEWLLALDADYITDSEFARELSQLSPAPDTNAFFADFIYCVWGRPLRASLYPPRAVLFRKQFAHYIQDGHTQLLKFEGKAGKLRRPIRHDDRKPFRQWIRAQDRYARLEVEKLKTNVETGFRDSLRKWILPAPFGALFYCLFGKGLVLDGLPGWYYAFQRTVAEVILSWRLIERKLTGHSSSAEDPR